MSFVYETVTDIALFLNTMHRASCSSSRSASISTTSNAVLQVNTKLVFPICKMITFQGYYGSNRSIQDGESMSTHRSSFQHDSPKKPSKAGVVITSFRQSKRR